MKQKWVPYEINESQPSIEAQGEPQYELARSVELDENDNNEHEPTPVQEKDLASGFLEEENNEKTHYVASLPPAYR